MHQDTILLSSCSHPALPLPISLKVRSVWRKKEKKSGSQTFRVRLPDFWGMAIRVVLPVCLVCLGRPVGIAVQLACIMIQSNQRIGRRVCILRGMAPCSEDCCQPFACRTGIYDNAAQQEKERRSWWIYYGSV